MKKLSLLTLVLLFGCYLFVFSQQTEAPDQTAVQTNQPAMTEEQPAATNAQPAAAQEQPAVTEEKEVQASEGVIYSDGKNIYASADIKFVISAKEKPSGIKQIHFMIDGSEAGIYENPITFASEGRHLISYKVEDNVGNISPLKNYEFIIDKTAPVVSISSDKNPIKIGDLIYIGADYSFSISAYDELSGLKSIEYSIDGGDFTAYESPFKVEGTNGLHVINYKAKDNVGNESEAMSYKFYLDMNPPSIDIAVEPAAYVKDGINYISGSSLIKLTANDKETGIASITYTIDGGDEQVYLHPFKLDGGEHIIKAKAVDLLNNTSDEASLSVTVDTETPEANIVPTKE